MARIRDESAQAVLSRILKLRTAGSRAEEIARELLSGDMETVVFLVRGLVEIALACSADEHLESDGELFSGNTKNGG